MNIKLIIPMLCIVALGYLQAMEEPEAVSNQPEFTSWESLPNEVKVLILSFVPTTGNFKEFQNLLLINPEFQDLLSAPKRSHKLF